jgi:hypothetical protein
MGRELGHRNPGSLEVTVSFTASYRVRLNPSRLAEEFPGIKQAAASGV